MRIYVIFIQSLKTLSSYMIYLSLLFYLNPKAWGPSISWIALYCLFRCFTLDSICGLNFNPQSTSFSSIHFFNCPRYPFLKVPLSAFQCLQSTRSNEHSTNFISSTSLQILSLHSLHSEFKCKLSVYLKNQSWLLLLLDLKPTL